MEIEVYATLRPIVRGSSVHLTGVSEIIVGQMLERPFDDYPHLSGLDTNLTRNDDIRFFPPVGGGQR